VAEGEEEMTRRITANLYMTLDGRGEFPKYPGSDVASDEADEFFRSFWTSRYQDVTTVVMGRRSFVGHRDTHSLRARKPNDPKFMFEYSRWLDRVDKVCLSRTLKETGWENSRLMKGDLSAIVRRLLREKGGNIIIEGGPRLIQDVLRRDLADDYWLVLMPVVYGRGPRYWGTLKEQRTLKLLSASSLEWGEVLLHYASRGRVPDSDRGRATHPSG
jgi:dihydrofolate reductase